MVSLLTMNNHSSPLNSQSSSPRDAMGGTHTATTAAGSFVANVSYKGLGLGVVRGGAPWAHLAVYKPCCYAPIAVCAAAHLLKAFDEAIYDGVDVLSLSVVNYLPKFAEVDKRNAISTSSFHAVAKGISVVCAADNAGPSAQTVGNVAPWILTVAATTIDRSFPTPIMLGNNITLPAMFVGKEVGFTALVYPEGTELFPTTAGVCESSFASQQCPGPAQAISTVSAVRSRGGGGAIIARHPTNLLAPFSNDFPCIAVERELGTQILLYIRSTRSPVVKLSPSKTLVGKPVSTKVAYFSARGSNSIVPAILKPDIAAPGVSILAASTPSDPSMDGGFALHSGTSMATPHIASIVAPLKALHPDWSPAAIKSALVTTAWKTHPFGETIFAEGTMQKLGDPFDYGGGLVNPNKAADPGLIYDMGIDDYINYLCAVGYNTSAISLLVGQATACPIVKPYIRSTRSPVVKLSPSKTLVGKPVSTKVAYFSARGPNSIAPAILKPDIAAHGVSILAASTPSDPGMDGGFALHSGTSMATPHIASIVAPLKALHPDWSPAAIKSALVTTAWKADPFGKPISAEGTLQKLGDPFDYGGLVNPNKAADPGLIYDMGTDDYINYLCAVGYNTSAISQLVGQATACPIVKPSILDVNLPSITIPNPRKLIKLPRSVTNVGHVNSVSKAQIDPRPGIKVTVKPERLVFNSTVKTSSFTVAVSTSYEVNTVCFFGSLTWSDGIHAVTSATSVRTEIIQSCTDDN